MADSSLPQARTLQQIQALTNKTDAEIYTSDLNLTVDVYHINVEVCASAPMGLRRLIGA